MLKVEVSDDLFDNSEPYQDVLSFTFDEEDEAVSFVKDMLHQGKVAQIFFVEEKNGREANVCEDDH